MKKAKHEALLVYAMTGETLPQDHGFHVRALLPEWATVASVSPKCVEQEFSEVRHAWAD